MEEQTIKNNLPELHEYLSETPLSQSAWSQIHSDLSDLNWLTLPPDGLSTFLSGFFAHIERQISSFPTSSDFYYTFRLNRVKIFIFDSLFSFIWHKEKCKELCQNFKKSLKDLSFFKSSEETISKSEGSDFIQALTEIEKNLKLIKEYMHESVIHLSKPFQDEHDKDVSETIDEIFFSEVLEPHKTKLKALDETKRIFKDFKPNVYFSSSRYSNNMYNSYHKIENVYLGQLSYDRKRQGYGKMYFSNLNYYEGHWQNDKPEGNGLCIWKDGGKYAGDFKSGRLEGAGKRLYSNGNLYEGGFYNSKRKGKGKMKFKNGDIYDGEWSSDEMQGKGMYVWSSGDMYVGEFNRDKKDGKGTLTLSTGEVYQGNWSSGVYKPELSS